ncbi:MAG: hypothetical protein AAGF84_10375 [Planctomycetota bacterium]
MLLPTDAEFEEALAPLVGQPMREIGRASSLLWISIGDATANTRPWSLHTECAWRITRENLILVGRGDFYEFPGVAEPENWDWDHDFSNRFDAIAKEFNAYLGRKSRLIEAFAVDSFGGVSLVFDHDHRFEVFPSESSGNDAEWWRLLPPNKGEDYFVVPRWVD